jgi:hypothetical protein
MFLVIFTNTLSSVSSDLFLCLASFLERSTYQPELYQKRVEHSEIILFSYRKNATHEVHFYAVARAEPYVDACRYLNTARISPRH